MTFLNSKVTILLYDYYKTSTLGTWRPIVFNALRLMNNVQMTKICWNDEFTDKFTDKFTKKFT